MNDLEWQRKKDTNSCIITVLSGAFKTYGRRLLGGGRAHPPHGSASDKGM